MIFIWVQRGYPDNPCTIYANVMTYEQQRRTKYSMLSSGDRRPLWCQEKKQHNKSMDKSYCNCAYTGGHFWEYSYTHCFPYPLLYRINWGKLCGEMVTRAHVCSILQYIIIIMCSMSFWSRLDTHRRGFTFQQRQQGDGCAQASTSQTDQMRALCLDF